MASGPPAMDLFDLRGRTVLVTGGSRGIGRRIAEGFVRAGARVIITSRKADACAATARELTVFGACEALPGDIATAAGVERLRNALASRTDRLEVLVNNAGFVWVAPIDDFPETGWDRTFDVNVKGVFFLTQALLPLLRRAATRERPACIINIASTGGMEPVAFEAYAYSASKAACLMLTRQLARRLAGDHVLVNAIAPGPFPSRMMDAVPDDEQAATIAANPLKRMGTMEDIAGVAIFLASRAAAYTTGAVIPCDGGLSQL